MSESNACKPNIAIFAILDKYNLTTDFVLDNLKTMAADLAQEIDITLFLAGSDKLIGLHAFDSFNCLYVENADGTGLNEAFGELKSFRFDAVIITKASQLFSSQLLRMYTLAAQAGIALASLSNYYVMDKTNSSKLSLVNDVHYCSGLSFALLDKLGWKPFVTSSTSFEIAAKIDYKQQGIIGFDCELSGVLLIDFASSNVKESKKVLDANKFLAKHFPESDLVKLFKTFKQDSVLKNLKNIVIVDLCCKPNSFLSVDEICKLSKKLESTKFFSDCNISILASDPAAYGDNKAKQQVSVLDNNSLIAGLSTDSVLILNLDCSEGMDTYSAVLHFAALCFCPVFVYARNLPQNISEVDFAILKRFDQIFTNKSSRKQNLLNASTLLSSELLSEAHLAKLEQRCKLKLSGRLDIWRRAKLIKDNKTYNAIENYISTCLNLGNSKLVDDLICRLDSLLPDDAFVHNLKGFMAFSDGDTSKAKEHFFHALDLERDNDDAIENLKQMASQSEKRLLSVWDFNYVPYSVGDLITMLNRAGNERLDFIANKVDIAFVIDHEEPQPLAGPFKQGINKLNFQFHLDFLISIVYYSPYVGSFFIFDTRDELLEYIDSNKNKYTDIMPDQNMQYLRTPFMTYFNAVQNFYLEHGFLLPLTPRTGTILWAYEFFDRHAKESLPITINIRNSPLSDPQADVRNATLDAWLGLFEHISNIENVHIILIGALGEIDNRFREFKNVTVAKDYQTSASQDFALASTSYFHIGSASGPLSPCIHGQKPMALINYTHHPSPNLNGLFVENLPDGGEPVFYREYQSNTWGTETTEILIERFDNLLKILTPKNWRSKKEDLQQKHNEHSHRSKLAWIDKD